MGILHLIDAASPQATCTTLALMAQSEGRLGDLQQRVLLLGGGALADTARYAGIASPMRLAVPFGKALMGWPGVARLIRRDLGDFDLVHCWSVGTLVLSAFLLRSRPRVLTLTTLPSAQVVKLLRVLCRDARGRTVFLPISSTIRRELLGGGVPPNAVHVLRPGIDQGRVAHGSRGKLRRGWGIGSDKTKTVALLCDPAPAASAHRVAVAMSIANDVARQYDIRLKLVVHPDQRDLRRVANMLRHTGRSDQLIQDARLARPWEVLPGCDMALVPGVHGGGLSLLWAMSANLPIIGEATHAISEIVEDRHSALLAKPNEPKALAHRIHQLLSDHQLAWRLKDTARHEAYSFFSRQRYCQSLKTVYEQLLAGGEIQVPPMEATGGLRFMGRA